MYILIIHNPVAIGMSTRPGSIQDFSIVSIASIVFCISVVPELPCKSPQRCEADKVSLKEPPRMIRKMKAGNAVVVGKRETQHVSVSHEGYDMPVRQVWPARVLSGGNRRQ